MAAGGAGPAVVVDGAARAGWIAAADDDLVRQCDVDRYRASGPGGQHRNKTESAVRLRHKASGVTAYADDSRSQAENKARAIKRLRTAIALEVRIAVDLPSFVPSARLSKLVAGGTAPLGEKTRQTPDFLIAFAELLDVFAAGNAEVAVVAERVGCGSAALSRLLLVDEKTARTANELRKQHALRPLR